MRVIMDNKPKVFQLLSKITDLLPLPIYWLDINTVFMGANNKFYETMGVNSDFAVGTTGYDVYPYEIAAHIVEHDKGVMSTGTPSVQEESTIDFKTGIKRYFLAYKNPIYEDQKVVGLVGSLIDITAKKEAEQLRIENEKHETEAKIQARFKKDVNQVVHDIRSPLASLEMLATYCADIPEKERESFRRISTTITDIANNFLNKYNAPSGKDAADIIDHDQARPVLIALLLEQLVSEKRFEYQSASVDFVLQIDLSDYFACLCVQPLSLKRALSNIINNGVEAFIGTHIRTKRINIELTAAEKVIYIQVTDNGKGIPEAIKNKILQGTAVTEGKSDGHGIGMGQVLEMVNRNSGELAIGTIMNGGGTSIRLTFKRSEPPNWLANEINLHTDSLLVVLDDDDSIHQAWDIRFSPLQKEHTSLEIHHFKQADQALQFIRKLTREERERLFLLSDYELLNQDYHGLDVIKTSQPCQSLLVTSHYNDVALQKAVIHLKLKMLPKELAPKVAIHFTQVTRKSTNNQNANKPKTLKSVDLVLVEDNPLFASQCIELLFAGKKVDHHTSPESLLNQLTQYAKETPFALDNHYDASTFDGLALAEHLHQQDYKRIYLLSGDTINPSSLPDYLVAFIKNKQGLDGLKATIFGEISNPLSQSEARIDPIGTTPAASLDQTGNSFLGGILGFVHRIVHDVRTPLMTLSIDSNDLKNVLPTLLATYSAQPQPTSDKGIHEKIEQLCQSQAKNADDTKGMQANILVLDGLNESLWRNFHNLLEQQLSPAGFTVCKIYHVVQYALSVCNIPLEERRKIQWKRKALFEFWGNEIASIELIKNLLLLSLDYIRDGRYQTLLITQIIGDTHHKLKLKQVCYSALEDQKDTSSIKNNVEEIIKKEWLDRLSIKLECQNTPSQDLEWILSFPSKQ